jgi:hypothetical protein
LHQKKVSGRGEWEQRVRNTEYRIQNGGLLKERGIQPGGWEGQKLEATWNYSKVHENGIKVVPY